LRKNIYIRPQKEQRGTFPNSARPLLRGFIWRREFVPRGIHDTPYDLDIYDMKAAKREH
jgi:hypothetical protein